MKNGKTKFGGPPLAPWGEFFRFFKFIFNSLLRNASFWEKSKGLGREKKKREEERENNGVNNGHLRLPPPACASQPLAHALHSTNSGHYVLHQRVQVNRWRTHSLGPKLCPILPCKYPIPNT